MCNCAFTYCIIRKIFFFEFEESINSAAVLPFFSSAGQQQTDRLAGSRQRGRCSIRNKSYRGSVLKNTAHTVRVGTSGCFDRQKPSTPLLPRTLNVRGFVRGNRLGMRGSRIRAMAFFIIGGFRKFWLVFSPSLLVLHNLW